jgi:ATP-dependent Clp protease ATP-binding subunit ClpC
MAYHYTKNLQKIIETSRQEAIHLGQNYIGADHFLLGILKNRQCTAFYLLESLGINTEKLTAILTAQLQRISGMVTIGNLPFTKRAERILKNTYIESRSFQSSYLGSAHLLLAISREEDGSTSEILKAYDVQYEDIRQEILHLQLSNSINPGSGREGEINDKSDSKNEKQTALDLFGQDFTKMAAENKLDPVIGREDEIMRVAQILCRRKKNNPVLLGEPGVGKTAIVEGLAIKIINKNIPQTLLNKKLINIDLGNIVAGTKYRGQFEERIKSLMDELRQRIDVIIFIDELHTLVGAGSAQGSLDAANLLKPALARGEIQCIGATTYSEYRKFIEKDGALERRFQKIAVNPPSTLMTVEILTALKDRYEKHHHVEYTDSAIMACVNLSERYITDKFLPDKAFDLMDEAGARVHLESISTPPTPNEQESALLEIGKQKELAILQQNYELAANYRDKELELQLKIKNQKKSEQAEKRPKVEESHIAELIAQITGIQVQKLAESEKERYLNTEKELQKKIFGQDEALRTLSQTIRRARAGLKDPRRPVGSFLFLGPSGVGKTETAKQLAAYLFDNSNALIKIDMSEYMERFSVSRLIGAPPGYVGHEEGGMLTEAVRKYPYAVILFDEIEKAHDDIYNILLQILDDGILTDTLGRKIDFKNTIIIITSNTGHEAKYNTPGFTPADREDEIKTGKLLEYAKAHFRPEFINRLDDIIVFKTLKKDNIVAILKLQLSELSLRISKSKDGIQLTDRALTQLTDLCYHLENGAREVRRIIQTNIEDAIAEKLLSNKLIRESPILIDFDGEFHFINEVALLEE